MTSFLWRGTRKRSIFRGGITPAHLAALGVSTRSFAGELGVYVDMDSAKFRGDWATFEIRFNLPKRNTSEDRKK